jgi:hypothetical protein
MLPGPVDPAGRAIPFVLPSAREASPISPAQGVSTASIACRRHLLRTQANPERSPAAIRRVTGRIESSNFQSPFLLCWRWILILGDATGCWLSRACRRGSRFR